ncbi:hypothetical protein Ancab_002626 [Ancistrocladus abbreviatus]
MRTGASESKSRYCKIEEQVSGQKQQAFQKTRGTTKDDFRKVDNERAHTAEESKEDSSDISTSRVPCRPDELIGAPSANDAQTENGIGYKETKKFSKVVSSNYLLDSCPNEEEANRGKCKRRQEKQSLQEKAEKDKTRANSAFMATQGTLINDIQWGHRGSRPPKLLQHKKKKAKEKKIEQSGPTPSKVSLLKQREGPPGEADGLPRSTDLDNLHIRPSSGVVLS